MWFDGILWADSLQAGMKQEKLTEELLSDMRISMCKTMAEKMTGYFDFGLKLVLWCKIMMGCW